MIAWTLKHHIFDLFKIIHHTFNVGMTTKGNYILSYYRPIPFFFMAKSMKLSLCWFTYSCNWVVEILKVNAFTKIIKFPMFRRKDTFRNFEAQSFKVAKRSFSPSMQVVTRYKLNFPTYQLSPINWWRICKSRLSQNYNIWWCVEQQKIKLWS